MVVNMLTVRQLMNDINTDYGKIKYYVGNFLDEFYKSDAKKKYLMIKDEPNIKSNIPLKEYALIAASIHLLCSNNGIEPPKWIFNAKYFLDEPYFTNDEKGEFRKYLLLNSPPEFKIRNLFVLPNILSRV